MPSQARELQSVFEVGTPHEAIRADAIKTKSPYFQDDFGYIWVDIFKPVSEGVWDIVPFCVGNIRRDNELNALSKRPLLTQVECPQCHHQWKPRKAQEIYRCSKCNTRVYIP